MNGDLKTILIIAAGVILGVVVIHFLKVGF
jgi:hypothetical protein